MQPRNNFHFSIHSCTIDSESKNSKKSGGRGKGRKRNNKSGGSGGKSRTSSRLANRKRSALAATTAPIEVSNHKKRLASSDLDTEGASFAKTPKIQCKRDFCSTPTSTTTAGPKSAVTNGRTWF